MGGLGWGSAEKTCSKEAVIKTKKQFASYGKIRKVPKERGLEGAEKKT